MVPLLMTVLFGTLLAVTPTPPLPLPSPPLTAPLLVSDAPLESVTPSAAIAIDGAAARDGAGIGEGRDAGQAGTRAAIAAQPAARAAREGAIDGDGLAGIREQADIAIAVGARAGGRGLDVAVEDIGASGWGAVQVHRAREGAAVLISRGEGVASGVDGDGLGGPRQIAVRQRDVVVEDDGGAGIGIAVGIGDGGAQAGIISGVIGARQGGPAGGDQGDPGGACKEFLFLPLRAARDAMKNHSDECADRKAAFLTRELNRAPRCAA